MRFDFFAVVAFATTALAQSAAQNASAAAIAAKIPACVLPCDDAAFKAIGCGSTDYACHCAHGSQLSVLIPACLKNSTCTTQDLTTFASIPPAICAALNSTASTNSTSSAGAKQTSSSASAGASTLATTTPSSPSSTSGSSASGSSASGSSAGSASVTPSSSSGAGVSGMATGLFAVVGAGLLMILL